MAPVKCYDKLTDNCYRDIYRENVIDHGGYKAAGGKKLLANIPGSCKTVEFFRLLKDYYGFTLLHWSGNTDEYIAMRQAGWKNEELMLWINCDVPLEGNGSLKAMLEGTHITFPSYGINEVDDSQIHALYIDEPQTQKNQGCNSEKLRQLWNIAKQNNIEFVIGDFNPSVDLGLFTLGTNWVHEYATIADSIAYQGYYMDQRNEWTKVDRLMNIFGQPLSGKRAWISIETDYLESSIQEIDDLFGHANNLSFKELWIFGSTVPVPEKFNFSMDDNGKIYVEVVPDCETWAKRYLEPIIQVAMNKGWITRNYEYRREFSHREYCQRGDCRCDLYSSKDWDLTPLPLCPKGEIIVQKRLLIEKENSGIEDKDVQIITTNINSGTAPFVKRNYEYW